MWGKVVTFLRENKNIALQMCCGDICDIEIEGNHLIAKTNEDFNYSMISQDYAKKEIEKALYFLGYNYKFVPVLIEKDKDKQKEDIEKLKSLFGGLLKITN